MHKMTKIANYQYKKKEEENYKLKKKEEEKNMEMGRGGGVSGRQMGCSSKQRRSLTISFSYYGPQTNHILIHKTEITFVVNKETYFIS